MSLSRVLAMLPDKVVCIHAPWQRHQDTPSRPFPGRQAGRQQGAAGMQTEHQQNRKEFSAREKCQQEEAEKKEQQQLYGHVFLERECKIWLREPKARGSCSHWSQHLPVTAWLQVPEGAQSCTPPEGSGSPNHTLYLPRLITPKNADHFLFLWACGFVMRDETLAVLENSSNYSP